MELKEPLTDDEAQHLCDLKAALLSCTEKQLALHRRRIRNRIFRIRRGDMSHDNGLVKLLESQFSPDMSLDTFTFNWDVAPDDPLKVITVFEWKEHGGDFETMMVQDPKDGLVKPQKMCRPTGFTQQE